jgi:hypothetical protein
MTHLSTALTSEGYVDIESEVPLGDLRAGETVLGVADPDDPNAPRTTHVVTETLGEHHVPTEDPTWIDRILIGGRFERLVAGGRVSGVLVNGTYGPGLFALDTTPVLDRVAA